LKKDKDVDRSQSIALQTGRKLDRAIMVVLAIALAYFAFDKFVLDPDRDQSKIEIARQEGRTEAIVDSFEDKSIAVLPFVNMSDDANNEYFSDGISEELLNLLSKIPEMRVISRSSAFSFKDKEISIPAIAAQLNVAYILEGSVRKVGNQVRITAQLIEAFSDTHLWSNTYDRTLDDIFAVQDEVAAEVVKHLQLVLIGETPSTKPINPQAYTLFLQARQIRVMHQDQDLPRAEILLKQALEIDPEYVDALILLSDVASEDALAADARAKAITLDPDNAKIKAVMAERLFDQSEKMAVAARLLEEAAAIDPYEPLVLFNSARLANYLGQTDLAIRLGEYIAVRDPLFFWSQLNLAEDYFVAGRVEEALAQFEIALSLNTTEGAVQWKYGLAKLVAGDPEGALETFLLEEEPIYRTQGLMLAYHDLGREAESEAALNKLLLTEVEVWPWGLARAYAWTGDADLAFFYLKAALENGRNMARLATHPLFQKLHTDSRWLPFLQFVEQTQEQLASIEFSVQVPK
jgi:TolB-like protein/Tfp pilus assembly protein PilF